MPARVAFPKASRTIGWPSAFRGRAAIAALRSAGGGGPSTLGTRAQQVVACLRNRVCVRHPRGASAPGEADLKIACLDLEGVLIPEIWIQFSERTGIPELRRTTRDEPDYDKLMKQRLQILDRHRLGLRDIQQVIDGMQPLPGAEPFLGWLREHFQVVILSDTFYQFAAPFMRKLGHPVLFCHRLEVDAAGRVVDYRLRLADQKRRAVLAFRELAFRTIAAGDSYNDTSMLIAADAGILFRPPENVVREFPQFPVAQSYAELQEAFLAADRRTG